MKTSVVVGLGFGDEGKGRVTDWLCSKNPGSWVVRFNGGQQAGHTVCTEDGRRHVFSNFGSGTLRGCPTFWSAPCCIDPVGILCEYDTLVEESPRLVIHPKCRVTTPLDKLSNRGNKATMSHGTCGVGVGATFQREADHVTLRARDLQFPSILKCRLEMIQEYYKEYQIDIEEFMEDCERMLDTKGIEIGKPPENIPSAIFEGAQGFYLDAEYGFFPHVTRSFTTLRNVPEAAEVYAVTRSYLTRHGNGPFPSLGDVKLRNNENETNVQNQYQGAFRTGLINPELIDYAIEKYRGQKPAAKINLVVTCLDQFNQMPKINATVDNVLYSDSDKGEIHEN